MKQADGYVLKKICDVPYILPYGQNIAEFRRSVRINETGIFLWNSLKEPISEEDLFAEFTRHFEASEPDLPVLSKDFHAFLDTLKSLGMIVPDEARFFSIGGLTLCITGDPSLLADDFSAFQTDRGQKKADLSLFLAPHTKAPAEPDSGSGVPLIRTSELTLRETADSYHFDFRTMDTLAGGILQKDGASGTLYYKNVPSALQRKELLKEELFHAVRFFFLYRAQRSGIYAIHSASILYRGKAWLFSGPSGTGKSTHTALWEKLYHTPVLNGDLNLITLKDKKPVVHGLPWCGTSGIATTESYPLGGIIFLRQWKSDQVETLSLDEKALHILHRLISPLWNEAQLTQSLTFSEALASRCVIARLCCTKNDCAAQTMKHFLDTQLSDLPL